MSTSPKEAQLASKLQTTQTELAKVTEFLAIAREESRKLSDTLEELRSELRKALRDLDRERAIVNRLIGRSP